MRELAWAVTWRLLFFFFKFSNKVTALAALSQITHLSFVKVCMRVKLLCFNQLSVCENLNYHSLRPTLNKGL